MGDIIVLLFFIIFIAVILITYIRVKFFHSVSKENALIYVGGLGAGKTYVTVRIAINRYKQSYRKYLIRRYIFRRKIPPPGFYSTIPIRYRPMFIMRPRFTVPVSKDILLMHKEIPLYSITVLDEVELLISQFVTNFDEKERFEQFITLYRQATKGGSILMNTQSINKCNFILRYCLNTGFNLEKIFSFRLPLTQLSVYAGTAAKLDVTTKKADTEIDPDGFEFHERPKIVLFVQLEKHFDTYAYYDYYVKMCAGKYVESPYNNYSVQEVIQFFAKKTTKK